MRWEFGMTALEWGVMATLAMGVVALVLQTALRRPERATVVNPRD